jgi:hypothetical protein
MALARNYPMCENAVPAMIPALNRRGLGMTRFVQGADRGQWTLLPECLDDWVADDNPVRVSSIWLNLGSVALSLPGQVGRGIIRPRS